jgi:tetratricopeptide (TPR) repeat protein
LAHAPHRHEAIVLAASWVDRLEVSMSLTYGHLPEPAQRVYQLLVDHPGPATTAGPLAAALDMDEPDVTAALDLLHHAHQVERCSGERYMLSDRRHAAHLRREMPPSDRTLQCTRLIDWYAATADAAVPLVAPKAYRFGLPVVHEVVPHGHGDEGQARTWFGWEHLAVRNVLSTAVDRRHHGVAVELAEAIWHLARLTYHHDDLVHAQHAGYIAATRCQPAIAVVFRAREAAGLSDLGHHDDALAAATDAIDQAADTGDSRIIALGHSQRGRVHLVAGRPDDALHDLSTALAQQRRPADDAHGYAVLHRRIGQAYLARGHLDDAIKYLRASSEAMASTGNQLGMARAVTYQAEALIAAGRVGEALARLSQARRLVGDTAAVRYRVGLDLAAARAARHLGKCGIAGRITHDLIAQLTLAGPGAAADLQATSRLREQL